MPRDSQRKSLEHMRFGRPPLSYWPLRSLTPDIFNVQYPLLSRIMPTDWHIVENDLRRKCTGESELVANLSSARGLYGWIIENKIDGRKQEFFPWPLGAGGKVVYWLSVILQIEGQPTVPFIDPRRTRGLTQEGRRFVFSVMNERIRAENPEDYADVRFVIMQSSQSDGSIRHPILHSDKGVELFSLDQLESMVAWTYELWHEVYEERVSGTRRAAAGPAGTLI